MHQNKIARNVPKLHWGDVVLIASYLINRMPTQVLENKNSLETLKNYFPPITSCSSIPSKAFGCNVFMHIPDRSQAKLCHKSNNCIYIYIYFFWGIFTATGWLKMLSRPIKEGVHFHGCKFFLNHSPIIRR